MKKKTMFKTGSRYSALLCVLSMTAGCLTGCGNTVADNKTDVSSAATGTTVVSTTTAENETTAETFDPRAICEGVTLTIAIADDDLVIDWNTNEMTLAIEEALGVDLKFEAYASADFLDKINVMVNGGDELPDMIWGSNAGVGGLNGSYENWASEEVLIPLNEYYENPDYSANINEACEKIGVDIPSLLEDADGNIWAAPAYYQFPTNTVPCKLWINKEYCQKLGFDEIPTTTEGFYELCKAIATDIEAGLLADFWYYPQMLNSEDKFIQNSTRLEYDYIPGLEGPEGRVEAFYVPIIPGAGGVITIDCENPDAAFLVMDYMCRQDLSISNRYGQQGEDWDYWENVDESRFDEGITKENYTGRLASEYPEPIMIAYSDGTFWSGGNPNNRSYMQAGPGIVSMDIYWGIAIKKDTSTEAGQVAYEYNQLYVGSILETLNWIPDEHVTRLPMTSEEISVSNEIQVTLSNYVRESIGAFLTGQWDIDEYWDTYMAELEKIGYKELLEIYQTSYDRTK